uniref:Endonuclease/exonuclease/phosphatase domain-containing protein n=2 Tax=Arion vulgaris TaxID=1028688 RepID=A0A0B7BQ42_9EUPU
MSTEFIAVQLLINNTKMTLYNIYSPPSIQTELEAIKVQDDNLLIVGDFNSHSPSWGYDTLDPRGESLEEWLITNSLTILNHPDDPHTCYSRRWRTTSTPDLAFATDDIHRITERQVCDQIGGSDHRPVKLLINNINKEELTNSAPSWNYKKADWKLFQELADKYCKEINQSGKVDRDARSFNKAILDAAKKAIPRGRRKNYKPYWTPEMEVLHSSLCSARNTMELAPTDQNVMQHNRARALYVRERNQQCRKSWKEKTASLNMEKDTQKLWRLTKALNDDNPSRGKTVLQQGEQLLTGKRAATLMAQCYKQESSCSISQEQGKEVRSEINATFKKATSEPCMEVDITLTELQRALKKLNRKKAPGPDGVSNDMLKQIGPIAQSLLLQIFNNSWRQGRVPDIWKNATIHPIFKSGKDKKDPQSYRPISLLSCTAKLLERVITTRLQWFLESNYKLDPAKTGYRQHRSTDDQVAYLTQDIENGFQENPHSVL